MQFNKGMFEGLYNKYIKGKEEVQVEVDFQYLSFGKVCLAF